MVENGYYSVIAPESCATIIYRDSGKAPDAARALRLASTDLKELGLIDGIIPEPAEGAHTDADRTAESVRETVHTAIAELSPDWPHELVYDRYRQDRRV